MKNIAQKRIPATLNSSQPLQRKVLAAVVAACFISAAQANPAAPQVVAGQASFNQQGNLFSITNTPNTIINWQSFSIGANDITRFIQQSSDSKVLNRITGQDPSQILGALQSNGKVFLINPNGVMFGAGSRVDVNGLVASSLNLSDADFLAGKNNFVGNASAGKVSNQGTITTPGGGQVFLIAPNVDNSGIITSPNGEIILAAGESVQLVDSANPDVHVQISAPLDQALNLGQIVAQGGRVGIYGALVNQRGHVSADSAVRGDAGQIILKSSGTTLLEAGSTTTATGANGAGGSVELLGQQVGLMGNAKVDASGATGGGTVLVGGDYHGQNPAVQNAQSSYVGADAAIAADAVQTGQGGKVIVWSDQATRAYGSISARGGAQGGDGGFVETSGAYLDVAGIKVSTAAAHGKLGQWLLDPDDIVVDNSGAATLDGDITFGGSGTSTIAPSAFDGSTSSVVLQANNSISFNSPVAMTVAAAELTARAGGNISVNSTISTNNGAVTLTANYTLPYPLLATGTGAMHGSSGGAINTNSSGGGGAAISLSGATVTIEDQLNAGSGLIALSANGGSSPSAGNIVVAAGSTSDMVTLTSGTITLVASNDITLNAPVNLSNQSGTAFDAYAGNNITLATGSRITTAGGGVSLQANDGTYSAASGTGVLAVNPNSGGISTNGGNVLMSGASLMLEDNVNTGTGNLQLYATDGDITLNGALTADTANLTATHDIIFNNSVNVTHVPALVTGPDQPPPTFNAHAGNTITLTATGSITTAGGDVELSGTNFQLAGNTNTGVGTLNVQSDVAGGAITIASTSTLAGNAVNLVADSMQLGGHINTGNDVWIGSYSPNATINLGASATNSGADGVYVLGLTDTELNTISTHQLLIGDVLYGYTGIVNVNDALNLTGITGLSLMGGNVGIHAALSGPNSINLQSVVAGGAISVDSGATVSASYSYLQADNMVLNGHISSNSLTGSVTISTYSPTYGINLGAGATSSAAVIANGDVLGKPGVLGLTDTALGNISAPYVQISTAGALDVTGALNLVGGTAATNGLQLAGSSIAINASLSATQNVSLRSLGAGGAISIDSGATVSASYISLQADDMALNGHINSNSPTGSVTISTYSPTYGINLGAGATSSAAVIAHDDVLGKPGVLGLTDTALSHISADSLTIGGVSDNYTGTVSVNDALNLTGITGLNLMGGNVGIHAALSGPNSINLQSLVAGGAITIDHLDSGATLAASYISLQADSMVLNGHINSNSPTGSVSINTLSPNYGINLGAGATSSAAVIANGDVLGKPGVLGLTDTVLGNISATYVQISTAGALGVTGALNLVGGTAATNSLQLTGGSIAVNAPLSANQNVNLSSSGGNIAVNASLSGTQNVNLSSIGGNIAINASLSATQNLYLSSGGNITENCNGIINAPSLSFVGASSVNLGGNNNVSYLAGWANGGNLRFNNGGTGSLLLTKVDGRSGLQASNHTVTLTSGGDISQDAYGYVVASKLVLNTLGSVDLTAAGGTNMIGELEAQNIGSLKLTQSRIPVTLGGSGDDVNGVTLSTSSISGRSITVSDGDGITVAQPVDGNGAPVSLFGGTGGITVNAALSASTLGLTADHMSFSAPLTAQLASFTNATANLPIHVGDAGGSCSPYLALNDLSQVSADAISIGAASGSAVSGAIKVGGFGSVIQPLYNGVPTTSTLTLLTGAGITQTGPIVVPALGVQAGGAVTLTDPGNAINSVAAQLTAGNFTLATSTDLSLVRLTDTLSSSAMYDLNGISTPGNVNLTSSGAITRGTIIAGDGGITAHTLTLQAGNGIGADGAPLVTSVLTLSAQNQTGGDGGSSPINIKNTDQAGDAPLMTLTRAWQSADGEGVNSGSITIENFGAMVVSGGDSSGVQTNTGAITLFTHSPLTINGQVGSTSGAIALSAGASGGNNDTLTIANGNLVSTSGPITLAAGGSVNVTTGTVLGNVTMLVKQKTPGLSTCIANPSISGCSTVLPSLSSCTSNPGLTGCSVVLPSLASCTNSPGLAGCSVVLPSLSSCTNNPGLAGCSAVLPSLASCTTAPTLDGCVAVLPSLSSCTTNPTLAGCSAVLPSLSSCTTTPALAGCSAVLPSLSSCTTTPTLAGCSAVLPSLSSCTTTPTLGGCSAVLPSLSSCTTTPTLGGCSAVLPSLSSCTTIPTLGGCSAVLPSLSSCTITPTQAGCLAVLPSLSSCTTTPTLAGCSAVLPSLSSCTSNPTAAGCSAVLPSLSSCTTTPTLAGCSAVLPSLSSCTTTPTLVGCSAVLPSLSSCATTPTLAGCSAVLPSLSSCATTPTLAGCSAVLPTLSSCTSNPTQAGCLAVLPSLSNCTTTPTLAGCSAVLPSLSSCTTTPTLVGCSAVLPSLSSCATTPTLAGCSAVLPSLSSCTTTPSLAGCSAVLPSLSSCTSNPTAAGCSAVLPTLASCTANPTAAGCSAVLPTLSSCTI